MCGVTGIFAPGRDAARLAYFALYALQHRGQESAGIAAADGGTLRSHKKMGLLGAIFGDLGLVIQVEDRLLDLHHERGEIVSFSIS